MESHNYLGIYISKNSATVVCLGPQKKGNSGVKCFSVSVEEQEQQDIQALVGLIAKGCAERNYKFSGIAVALDCSMFMQHSVHSEFKEPKQIAATVRFDTEEALATDITNVSVAFEIDSSDQDGSRLTVFTSERKILTEILDALQQYNLDPVNIEPDVNCLSRFICRHAISEEAEQAEVVYGLLSNRNGYLIVPPITSDEKTRKSSIVRTFLVGSTQDRTKLLQREVLITTALVEGDSQLSSIKTFDSADSVNSQQLGEKLGIEGSEVNLSNIIEAKLQPDADNTENIDFAIAYGAAIAFSEKGRSVDFREDFCPFQGKKQRQRKTLKTAAISITILFISVGLYFQTQLFSVNKDRNDLRSKFAIDYSDVTLEQLPADLTMRNAVRELGKLQRRIENEKKGLNPEGKPISSNLTMVLRAFGDNKCAEQTDLNINTINVTAKNIILSGDTAGREKTLKLVSVLEKNGLKDIKFTNQEKGGRDHFNLTLIQNK